MSSRAPEPTIGLCMIVRNEAAIIERCLGAVRGLIEHWVIVDTGSTDGTPEIVERVLAGVPGELHHREWVDFGHNRSELMALARGTADLLLLLDADHVLVTDGVRPPVGPDSYLLRHTGTFSYEIPRLVRGDRAWHYVGSTHEYLACDGPVTRESLPGWHIDDRGDGGSKADKFTRDRALLEREFARDPTNPRTVFYLAQTLRDLGEVDAAIAMYTRRVELGGWDEEVFYAQFQRGALLARNDFEAAVPVLLDAWQRRPTRAEPLYELASGYRDRGSFHLAYEFASRGLQLTAPDDLLFVHDEVYEYRLRFELAIAAYWLGRVEEALAVNEALLADGVPEWLEPWVRANRQWCRHALDVDEPAPAPVVAVLDTLPTLDALVGPGVVTRHDLAFDAGGWPTFNPSIAADGDGLRLMVRSANYRLVDGRYEYLDGSTTIRTRNHFLTLDRAGTLVGGWALPERPEVPGGPRALPSTVEGVEDCRIVEVDGRWFASGTVRDRNPAARCEIALLELGDGEVTRMHVLAGPRRDRHEKNWMPFVRDGELHYLYLCDPTIVLRADVESGAVEVVGEHAGPPIAFGFRGGSQGVAVDEGWLFTVHEVGTLGGGTARAYSHRVLLLSHSLEIVGITPPFCFAERGVEFCAGMAQVDDDLVCSVGIGDATAHVFRVPLAAVRGLLEPVAPVGPAQA